MLLATTSSDFLIPNGTFIAELILFIIVLGIVAKFILPPIIGAMDQRNAAIRAGLSAGDEGNAEAERLVAERIAVLQGARDEARVILDEVSKANEAQLEDNRARARAEHDRLIAAAQPGIAIARAEARAEVLGSFADLVVEAAGQVIGERVDATRHRAILDDAIAQALAGTGS